MPKCDFNERASQLRHGSSPVNLLHITPFTKNTSRWLLLNISDAFFIKWFVFNKLMEFLY